MLAQADATDIFTVVGLFIAVLVVGGAILIVWRRSVLGDPRREPTTAMLDSLRRQLESDEISQDEYDAARRVIVGHAAGDSPRALADRPAPHDAVVAEPGFDLTGDRLPERTENEG